MAVFIAAAFWNQHPPEPQPTRHWRWIVFFALVVTAYLWIAQIVPDKLVGEFGAFPILGVVALISDSTGAYDHKKLREIRATALLGPIVAMLFVWIVWSRVGQGFWFTETIFILIPLWLACLGVTALVNWVYRVIQTNVGLIR